MLHYALRIGLRRHFRASAPALRTMNTSTGSVAPGDAIPLSDQENVEVREDSTHCMAGGSKVEPSIEKGTHLAPPEVHTSLRCIGAGPSFAPSFRTVDNVSSVGCKSRILRSPRSDSNRLILVSPTVDVNSLVPHETRAPIKEFQPKFISDSELQGILRTVMPIPFKRTHHSLPHPATAQELELRMHQALTFTPLPSLARLLRYHDSFPSLHSAASYNFLVQLAIRHTSYSKAFQLLRRMEEAGIKPNAYSKLLYIRTLVRIGRWYDAWSFVRQALVSGNENSALPLLLELLGHHKLIEFRKNSPPYNWKSARVTPEQLPGGGCNVRLVRKWQKNILAVIPNHLPPDAYPPVHFILTVVRHLVRNSRAKTARAITMEWICHLPERLSLPRKRHCLCLLHLHLAFSSRTLEAYFSNRKFADLFLHQRPDVQPNSTTLFLLLRSLTRAEGKLTHHAIGLVRAFQKKWGSQVIDRRVRRRIVHIALREGRLDVAHTWMEAEERASRPRELMALQRAVVGEQAVRLPQKIRRMSSQKLMPGVDAENRKWRWLKRRLWMRKQSRLSRQTRSSMSASEGEKNVADRPSVDVESRAGN